MKKTLFVLSLLLVVVLGGCGFIKKTFNFAQEVGTGTKEDQAQSLSDAINEGAKIFGEDIRVDFKDVQNPDFSITTPDGTVRFNEDVLKQFEEFGKKFEEAQRKSQNEE